MKAFNVCATIMWIAKLNLAWLFFTLIGGVLLGAAPSTIAAFTCARRYHCGDLVKLTATFRATYRREFVRANRLLLPVGVVALALWWNWEHVPFSARFAFAIIPLGLIILLFVGSACVLPAMYVHYDVSLSGYYLKASRFAVRFLPFTVLLVFVTAAVYFVTSFIPLLALCFSVGAWIFIDAYLCGKFFDYNQSLLERAPADDARKQVTVG